MGREHPMGERADVASKLNRVARDDLVVLCRIRGSLDGRLQGAVDEAIGQIVESMRVRARHWSMPWQPIVMEG